VQTVSKKKIKWYRDGTVSLVHRVQVKFLFSALSPYMMNVQFAERKFLTAVTMPQILNYTKKNDLCSLKRYFASGFEAGQWTHTLTDGGD